MSRPATAFEVNLIVGILALVLLVLLHHFVGSLRLNVRYLKALLRTPPTLIRDAGDGLVKLRRTIGAKDWLTSPLTKEPCVWFHVRAQEKVKTNRRGLLSEWVTRLDLTRGVPFALDDGSGSPVAVAPSGVVLRDAHSEAHDFFHGLLPSTREALTWQHGLVIGSRIFGRRWRVRERIVRPRDRFWALGVVRRRGDELNLVGHQSMCLVSNVDERVYAVRLACWVFAQLTGIGGLLFGLGSAVSYFFFR